MAASNAIRVRASDWELGDVFRTPSTIGKVEGKVGPKTRTGIVCDWFQATMPSSLREAVLKLLTSALGPAEVKSDIPKQMRCYRECLQFPDGARLYHLNDYRETCCLVISGKAKPTEHFCLLKSLLDLGVKATRMDLAFDDRRGVLSLGTVRDAGKAGNAISRWKEFDTHEKASLSSGVQRGQRIQFGSKSSASYLVAYDKGLETGIAEEGEWVRWELRLADLEADNFSAALFSDTPTSADTVVSEFPKKPKAEPVLLCYDSSEVPVLISDIPPEFVERFERLALDALKSRLSFRDRATASNVSRAKQLPWWESFLEYFDPLPNGIPNQECAEYEGGQSLTDKKKYREIATRGQAEEILTAIYEEHIRPHVANHFKELLRNIPEYGDPAPASGDKGIDEAALALVGLLPIQDNNLIPFPSSRWRGASDVDKTLQHRSADVIKLGVWRLGASIGGG